MKLLGKRTNKKLKSVTIIHSATTETVRLPEDNNGVIVHTAIRTKVPFKKKVRGERSTKTKTSEKKKNMQSKPPKINAVNTNGQILTKSKESTKFQKHSSAEVPKKSLHKKKNQISTSTTTDEQHQNKLNENKKNKKNKKHKEIIDYSNSSLGNHTNTFSKVQKWLLESPIVSQPLSHIEHSSKVRKVMNKSQSTPERLIQKSPKKTKSVGNLSNEKVKLQVVYNPPFKFSLKLSKNSTVKTHVIGGVLGNSKRKIRRGEKKGKIGVVSSTNAKTSNKKFGEKGGRRTALLIQNGDEDCKKLTVNNYETPEHNYETLNPKVNDNPYYENVKLNLNNDSNSEKQQQQQQQSTDQSTQQQKLKKEDKTEIFKPNSLQSTALQATQINKNQQLNNNIDYNRSNSVTNNLFNIKPSSLSSNIRKSNDNSMNLSQNFGSSQNLLPSSSQNHFFKSKKRSSLNLKSSAAAGIQNDLSNSNLHSKHNNSNLSLKHDIPSLNIKNNELFQNKTNSKRNSDIFNINTQSQASSSSSGRRGSISNIPRANLNNMQTGPTLSRQTSLNIKTSSPSSLFISNNSNTNNSGINLNSNNVTNINNYRPHTASCLETKQFEWPKSMITTTTNNNSDHYHKEQFQQSKHNSNNSNRNIKNEEPLPSDLEVMVSDLENLVS